MITSKQKYNVSLNAIAKQLLGFRNQYRDLLIQINEIKTYNIPEYDFLLDLKKFILYQLQGCNKLQYTFDRLDSLVLTYDLLGEKL